jgi:hypothetical protein
MTRDTVWVETPAAEATSLIVARPDLWITVIDPVIVPVIDNRIGQTAYPEQVMNVMSGEGACGKGQALTAARWRSSEPVAHEIGQMLSAGR